MAHWTHSVKISTDMIPHGIMNERVNFLVMYKIGAHQNEDEFVQKRSAPVILIKKESKN